MSKMFQLWWLNRFGYAAMRREFFGVIVIAAIAACATWVMMGSGWFGIGLVALPLVAIFIVPDLVRPRPWDEIEAEQLEEEREKARKALEAANGD